MIKQIDLTKFVTGMKLEEEFNRIIQLGHNYELTESVVETLLSEIYDYGFKTKFTTRIH